MKKPYDEYIFRMEDGTPIKPVRVSNSTKKRCRNCGRVIRMRKNGLGIWRAVEKDPQIVSPCHIWQNGEEFLLKDGGAEVWGEPVERGFGGCKVAFKLHRCRAGRGNR